MPPFFGAMTMATGELHDMYYPVQTVRRDVLDGYVSPEGARRDYGVVIDARTGEVDREATRELREQMAAASMSRQ